MLLVGGGGGGCCCHGGMGPDGGGGGWLPGGGGGGGIIPTGKSSRAEVEPSQPQQHAGTLDSALPPPTAQTQSIFTHTHNKGALLIDQTEIIYLKRATKKRHLAEIGVCAPTRRTLVLTHGMSVWSCTLAHWRRWGLHPRRRHTVGVGGHRRASHARHRRREAVRSSGTAGHAVVVPALGGARIHPRRPVMLRTTNAVRLWLRPCLGGGGGLPADHWWLVTVGSRRSRRPSLGDGMASGGGQRSLSQFGH